ncbi:MAG: nucleotidyltransferase family protein [Anaerolineae bacterium]
MTRQDVLQKLSEFRRTREGEFGIVRLGLFGSAARDQIGDDSDIDVVVELARPDLFALIGIKQELEAVLGRPVDVIRYRANMNAFLRQRLQQESIYV